MVFGAWTMVQEGRGGGDRPDVSSSMTSEVTTGRVCDEVDNDVMMLSVKHGVLLQSGVCFAV